MTVLRYSAMNNASGPRQIPEAAARWEKLPVKKRLSERYGPRRPSQRQLRVIELVAQGLKNREIACELGIGEYVVRNYLSAIYDKIGLSNRVELALWHEARLHEAKAARRWNLPKSKSA
jgi:DNA-binding NarL/FixJ family response regulator